MIVPDDHRTAKPVSDEVFQILAKQFAYDPGPLNARVEWTNDSHRDYVVAPSGGRTWSRRSGLREPGLQRS